MAKLTEYLNKGVLTKSLVAVVAVCVLVVIGFWQSISSFGSTPLDLGEETIEFAIPSGSGLIKVANKLAAEGIIDSPKKFVWMARLGGKTRLVQAGEYDLKNGVSPNQLLDQFVEGKVKQYGLTVVEGWNFQQMFKALAEHPKIEHKLEGLDGAAIMQKLGFAGQHPEGRFLPDTYHFPAGTSDIDFLKRAYKAMSSALEEEWQQRDPVLPYDTAYEALIMASIVEKETSVTSERGQIAGVFVRRLQKRMRLQTDPTVIYGMGEAYNGNIRRKDLKTDTPYNTYTRSGLPPTPIALPSREAINAALHPESGDSLYFVAKGDGSHYFSAKIEEHNKAVRKYQIRKRKKDYRTTPKGNSSL